MAAPGRLVPFYLSRDCARDHGRDRDHAHAHANAPDLERERDHAHDRDHEHDCDQDRERLKPVRRIAAFMVAPSDKQQLFLLVLSLFSGVGRKFPIHRKGPLSLTTLLYRAECP